jgi:hypothetical protein
VSEDLVQSADHKICEIQSFTVPKLSQISFTLLYEIIILRLGYHKLPCNMVSKMVMSTHKRQIMALALTFWSNTKSW